MGATSAARVRENRALWKKIQEQKAQERQAREREISLRMTRRFYPEGIPPLVCLDYRYWQAMRCGWNAMTPALRGRNLAGKLIEVAESRFWRWWCGMHYKQRMQLVELSRDKARRARTMGGTMPASYLKRW